MVPALFQAQSGNDVVHALDFLRRVHVRRQPQHRSKVKRLVDAQCAIQEVILQEE